MRAGTTVFVDTGAWIALALTRDPLHGRARATWTDLVEAGAKLTASVPIILETFTFLERNANRDVALDWRSSIESLRRFRLIECTRRDLQEAWAYVERNDFHKLSAVDATSFVLMKRHRVHVAFAFDHHFAQAGFRLVG